MPKWSRCRRRGRRCLSAVTRRTQVFLVLAQVGRADALVTGDADLLALRDVFPGRILTADELAAQTAA